VGGTVIEESDAATFVLPGLVLSAADRLDEARALWDDVFAHARASGSVFAFATASCFRSEVLHIAGALAEAEADGRAALDAAHAHGIEAGIPWVVAFLTEILLARGEVDAAEQVVEESGFGGDPPDTTHFHRYMLARGRLLTALGRHEDAVACLVEAGRRFEGIGGRNPAFLPWRSAAAHSLLQLGRGEDARSLAARELALAREWGTARASAAALVPLGLAQGGEDGLATLLEAADLLRDSPALVDRARALLELGAALRRSNNRAAARGSLREALQLAHDAGAAPLAARAHEELLATGARPRRAAISGRDSLTPSERRVAALAAEGHTNRAIAQSLFVAPKTVEVHLRNVFRKLDLSSRAQLAEALERPQAASASVG
jgi:DNA-binding CsgD family transcriptional regulator